MSLLRLNDRCHIQQIVYHFFVKIDESHASFFKKKSKNPYYPLDFFSITWYNFHMMHSCVKYILRKEKIYA